MIKKHWLIFTQILGCLIVPAYVLADPKTFTLAEVLDRALTESSVVKEIEARIANRRAAGVATSLVENPTLESELRIPVAYQDQRGKDEIAVSLSQPLRLSDFGARTRVNILMQNAAHAEQQLALLEFSQQVRLAYAKTWALEQRISQLKKFLERAALLENSVKVAREQGFLGAGEGHLFKADAIKARYQIAAILSDAARSRAELSKVAGFVVAGNLTHPALPPLPTVAEFLDTRSEFSAEARAALGAKLAHEQLRLAELDAYPKFAPRLIYEQTGDDTDYVGVGIAVELPLFNRNQGEKSARVAEVGSAASLQGYFAGPRFKSEVQALRESIEATTNLVQGYEGEIVPTLREALAAEEKLLASGQGSWFRVWQTLQVLSTTEAELIERTVKAHSDRAELAVLTGKDF